MKSPADSGADRSVGALSWRWLGRLDYRTGIARQEALRRRLLAGEDVAAVLLVEHEPVITLGRNATDAHLLATPDELAERGIELVRTSRGGDVTYHGPGQLMVYPVIRLRAGVVAFLDAIATCLAHVARDLGVPGAAWCRDPAGLWLGDAKLAACGIHLRRRVTLHGFAFNVSTPPEAWAVIVPCGLADRRVTSLDQARLQRGLGPAPAVADVAALVGPRVCEALRAVAA